MEVFVLFCFVSRWGYWSMLPIFKFNWYSLSSNYCKEFGRKWSSQVASWSLLVFTVGTEISLEKRISVLHTVRLRMLLWRKWKCQRENTQIDAASHEKMIKVVQNSLDTSRVFLHFVSQTIAVLASRQHCLKRSQTHWSVLNEGKWRDERTGSHNIVGGNVRYLSLQEEAWFLFSRYLELLWHTTLFQLLGLLCGS